LQKSVRMVTRMHMNRQDQSKCKVGGIHLTKDDQELGIESTDQAKM